MCIQRCCTAAKCAGRLAYRKTAEEELSSYNEIPVNLKPQLKAACMLMSTPFLAQVLHCESVRTGYKLAKKSIQVFSFEVLVSSSVGRGLPPRLDAAIQCFSLLRILM